MRYVGALFAGASEQDLSEIRTSMKSYLFTQSPLTRALPQNVQALALLALRIEDRSAGILLTTAIRMACSLGWNQSVKPNSPAAPLAMTDYLWWTLACEDIWLYVFTGTPSLVFSRDFKVRTPTLKQQPFFYHFLSLSNVVRRLLRPETVDNMIMSSASELLSTWEATCPDIVNIPIPELGTDEEQSSETPSQSIGDGTPPAPAQASRPIMTSVLGVESTSQLQTPIDDSTSRTTAEPEIQSGLTPNSIIQLVYAAVVGLLVLDASERRSHELHHLVNGQRRAVLIIANKIEERFRGAAFIRWRVLRKLSDIIQVALYILNMEQSHDWIHSGGSRNIETLDDLWDWWSIADAEAAKKEGVLITPQPTLTQGEMVKRFHP
ncbi:hypothetical protein V1511DRAFT_458497 [Dipodascopsis uninucleata]